MKTQHLAMACTLVSAGLTMPAAAVSLSQSGMGQVLLYPYYTVNRSQDTLVTIVNPHPVSEVVKVRFLEGYNSRPVLDFNLYLSGNDAWTAVVTQSGDGNGAVLRSGDHSCTTPAIPAAGFDFSTAQFDGSGALPADAGPHTTARTREGFIEVIVAGSIRQSSPTDNAITQQPNGEPDGGLPPGCATLPGSLLADIEAPGVLYGTGAVINVGDGMYYTYDAEGIEGFSDVPLITAATGPFEPSLASDGSGAGANAELSGRGGTLGSVHFARKIDAVTAVLMKDELFNQYIASAGLGAKTDWIVTFPTQRYYTDPAVSGSSAAVLPFRDTFHSPGRSLLELPNPEIFDREHGKCGDPFCLYGVPFHLDHAVNAITFARPADVGAPSGVLGSQLAAYLSPYADAGQASLVLPGNLDTGVDARLGPVWIYGYPVIGFMAYNLVNSNAQPGKLANYGSVSRFRWNGSTVCTQVTVGGSCL